MTQGELNAIRNRAAITQLDGLRLLAYAEEMAERLTDCWLLLDQLARCHPDELNVLASAARELLHKHECPGWK